MAVHEEKDYIGKNEINKQKSVAAIKNKLIRFKSHTPQ
jgi:hypothetical protein